MFKKIIFVFLLTSGFLFASGSSDRGLTYYKYLFKSPLGYDGSVFTAKHTAKEWKALFADDAKGFKKEFGGISPSLDELFASEKFKKMIPHIEAFVVHYAKDSGYSPHCGGNDIDEK